MVGLLLLLLCARELKLGFFAGALRLEKDDDDGSSGEGWICARKWLVECLEQHTRLAFFKFLQTILSYLLTAR